jgi:hypothetical protein
MDTSPLIVDHGVKSGRPEHAGMPVSHEVKDLTWFAAEFLRTTARALPESTASGL